MLIHYQHEFCRNPNLYVLEASTHKHVLFLLDLEKKRWAQRAHITNIKEGEPSTSYFFNKIKVKHHTNKLISIDSTEQPNTFHTDLNKVQEISFNHFNRLYQP